MHVASPDPSCAGEHEVAFSARGLGILHLLPRPGSPLQQSVDAPEQCRDAVSLHQERTATGGQSCSVGEAVPPHHIRQQQVLIVTYAHRYKRPPGKRKAAALAMPVVVKAADRAKAARRATNDGGSQPPPPSAGRAATRGGPRDGGKHDRRQGSRATVRTAGERAPTRDKLVATDAAENQGTARLCGPMELGPVHGGVRCRRRRQPCDDDPDDSHGRRQSHGEDQSASGLILRRLPATGAGVGHDDHAHPVSGPKTVCQRHAGVGDAGADWIFGDPPADHGKPGSSAGHQPVGLFRCKGTRRLCPDIALEAADGGTGLRPEDAIHRS